MKWPRFSLRLLLVVVTVLSVWAGIVSQQWRTQKRAVDHFTTLNCGLLFNSDLKEGEDYSESYAVSIPSLIARRVDPGYLSSVHSVNCTGVAPISDSDLLPMERFDQLTLLDISGHPVTDQALQNLSLLKKLRYLNCSRTKVTGAGFERLVLDDLCDLYLFGTALDDEGIKHISKFKNLRLLWINNTLITDDSFQHIAKLTKLRHLRLKQTATTREGIEWLKKQLPNTKIEFSY